MLPWLLSTIRTDVDYFSFNTKANSQGFLLGKFMLSDLSVRSHDIFSFDPSNSTELILPGQWTEPFAKHLIRR